MSDAAPPAAPSPAARPKRRVGRVIFLAFLLVSLGGFVWACVLGTSTDPEVTSPDALKPGQVDSRLILRDGEKWVQVSTIVESPIAQVWKVVHDHERMTEFMPRMAKLHVQEDSGTHRKVRIDFHFIVERYTEIDVDVDVKPDLRVEKWHRFGGTLPVNQGQWVLAPMGEKRTFARYEVLVDSGMPVPRFLERAILRDALKVVLTHVDTRIEELRKTDPAYLDTAK